MPKGGVVNRNGSHGGEGPPKLRYSYTVPPEEGSLGERIRLERQAKVWTQKELAERVYLVQPQISAYERGEIKMPDPATIKRLAESFGLEPKVLLDLTPWQGATRRLENVAPPDAMVVPRARRRPLLCQVIDACVALTDDELTSLLHRIEHLVETREGKPLRRPARRRKAADAPDHLTNGDRPGGVSARSA